MRFTSRLQPVSNLKDLRLKRLTEEQVEQIDELVALLEEQGEVRLIVERGVLKYINKVERDKAWKVDRE